MCVLREFELSLTNGCGIGLIAPTRSDEAMDAGGGDGITSRIVTRLQASYGSSALFLTLFVKA
jgi:hypothetical protein